MNTALRESGMRLGLLLLGICVACVLTPMRAEGAGAPGRGAGENMVFPADSGIVDVKAKYGATGDGVTDDTRAIRKAIDETKGTPGTLYFPDGTYLVSDTLTQGGTPHSRDRFLVFQGQSEAGTIIRLKDNCPAFAAAFCRILSDGGRRQTSARPLDSRLRRLLGRFSPLPTPAVA